MQDDVLLAPASATLKDVTHVPSPGTVMTDIDRGGRPAGSPWNVISFFEGRVVGWKVTGSTESRGLEIRNVQALAADGVLIRSEPLSTPVTGTEETRDEHG